MADVRDYIIAAKALRLDEWDESLHPRAENGQFGEGSDLSSGSKERGFKTFAEAKKAHLEHLAKSGWEVHGELKVPWVKSPAGTRFEFKAQAVHYGPADSRTRSDVGMLTTDVNLKTTHPHEFEKRWRDQTFFDTRRPEDR